MTICDVDGGLENQVFISLLTGFKQEESGRTFLREGPQRMAEGQTSKTRFLVNASESSGWIVPFNSNVHDEIAFGPRQLWLTSEVAVSQRSHTLSPA